MQREKAERKAFRIVINNPGTSFRVSNMCNLCESVILPLIKQPVRWRNILIYLYILSNFSDGTGQFLWIMGIFKSKLAVLSYQGWRASEGEHRCPNPLSLQVHCLLPDLSEAAAIVSSLALPASTSFPFPFILHAAAQHNLPEASVMEPGTLWKLQRLPTPWRVNGHKNSHIFLTWNLLMRSWTKYLCFLDMPGASYSQVFTRFILFS